MCILIEFLSLTVILATFHAMWCCLYSIYPNIFLLIFAFKYLTLGFVELIDWILGDPSTRINNGAIDTGKPDCKILVYSGRCATLFSHDHVWPNWRTFLPYSYRGLLERLLIKSNLMLSLKNQPRPIRLLLDSTRWLGIYINSTPILRELLLEAGGKTSSQEGRILLIFSTILLISGEDWRWSRMLI